MKILLFFLCVSCCLAAQSIIYSIADAYLDSSQSTLNFGLFGDGYAFRDLGYTGAFYELVTKFNISQVPTSIISATVVYKQQGVSNDELLSGPSLLFDVYTTSTEWTETGVTFSNPPVSSTKILTDYQDGDIYTVSFPVTATIASAKTANAPVVSFRVHSGYSAVMLFMKENGIQYRPYLSVTY